MSSVETPPELLVQRPKRIDALRNYELLIATARVAFAETGTATSMEEIARRAHVGIGTLYRHFPTRQALLEAVYLEELEGVCRSASDHAELAPWDALTGWLHEFVRYVGTKRALAEELLAYMDSDAQVFASCRAALFAAAAPLLERAQSEGVVRADTSIDEVVQMVSAIAKMPTDDPEQTHHILDLALDGLRFGA
jgi:AcrR family transcriptional regulator